MTQLDALLGELQGRIQHLTPEERAALEARVAPMRRAVIERCWTATPGPQLDAVLCKADILLYGGAAGGGKSAGIVGLAMTEHQRSLIMRRLYGDLDALIDMAVGFNGTDKGARRGGRPRMVTRDGRVINFGACAKLGDEQAWQGRPHDFLGLDEAVHFLEMQVRFLIGWVRTTTAGQRTRIVLGSNPPLSSEGFWIVGMFAPWLDPFHPLYPTPHGVLRWAVTTSEMVNDNDVRFTDIWVDGPDPVTIDGKVYTPMSRTFIPAKLDDNPYLKNDKTYRSKVESHIFRDALLDGNFMMARGDHDMQVIPTKWVREAMERWTDTPPKGSVMTVLACDVAQGGPDETVLARRYDHWYAPLIRKAGIDTKDGPAVAGLILTEVRDAASIIVDAGGGWGGSAMDHLKANELPVYPYLGAGASNERTDDPAKMKFYNKRAETWWRFREALNPASHPMGSFIQLPPDQKLLAGLTAPRWQLKNDRGIKIEDKDEIKKRLGRSPDDADAVVMAWADGQRAAEKTQLQRWPGRGGQAVVNLGHAHRKRMYRR